MAVLVCVTLMAAVAAGAQSPDPLFPQPAGTPLAQNLKRLSIEELTQLDITTASRRSEPLSQAAAAVSVLRGEDIRRSGAANLAEALRLADGIEVARADNGSWSISARGFNISTSNKLLVLIDGRTVYSPLFAGTFWSVQDVPLADIDRIEVIRGPGGAVWGANAVNGVVTIISKSAAATHGVKVVAGAGTEERAIVTGQVGGGAPAFDYRVYAKVRARDALAFSSGVSADDPVKYAQGGFRLEAKGSSRDSWLLQGDAYGGREGLFDRADTHVAGSNLMARWGRRFSPNSQLRAQVYFDLRLTDPTTGAVTLTGTMDFDTERVIAYEAGYRAELSRRVFVDLATFSNVYDKLRSQEFPSPSGQPVLLANRMNGRTYGADLSSTLLVLPQWRVHSSYSYLHVATTFDAGSTDRTRRFSEFNDPSHMFRLRSSVDLPRGIELDGFFRRIARLPHPVVPAYSELNARIGWRASPSWDISLIGQNLLHARHPEFLLASPTREEFQRGA